MPPELAEPIRALRTPLDDGQRLVGLTLETSVVDRLLDYLALLQKWNRVYNLTAIRDPQAMLTQHLLDSLSIVAPLRERLSGIGAPSVIDVGSGAGLPGIPMALALPTFHVTMVEPVGKKAAFIQHVIGELQLTNAASAACRIEQLRRTGAFRDPMRQPDLIVSRAFASLADMAKLIEPLCGPHTRVAAMKGQLPAAEIHDLPSGWRIDESIPLRVPGLDAQRHLILFTRSA